MADHPPIPPENDPPPPEPPEGPEGEGASHSPENSDPSESPDPAAQRPAEANTNADDQMIRGQVRHRQVSARVPEHVGRGVFSTGAIVLMGNNEFILDFVLRMAQPHQVAARVVLPHAVMPQMIQALRTNMDKFRERFGEPPALPKGDPNARKPSIDEIYDDLKMADEVLSGSYANGVMISHSPAEFCFDFITSFFPRSAVSARIFLSVPQVPRLLDALESTYREFLKRVQAQRQQQREQQQIMDGDAILRQFREENTPKSPDAPEAPPKPPEPPRGEQDKKDDEEELDR